MQTLASLKITQWSPAEAEALAQKAEFPLERLGVVQELQIKRTDGNPLGQVKVEGCQVAPGGEAEAHWSQLVPLFAGQEAAQRIPVEGTLWWSHLRVSVPKGVGIEVEVLGDPWQDRLLQGAHDLDNEELFDMFMGACHSSRWAEALLDYKPYSSIFDLFMKADLVWGQMQEEDYLEAFKGHPMIGDRESLAKKFKSTAAVAGEEQKATASASEEVLDELMSLNRSYLEKFGFVFLICATGKSCEDMRDLLKSRIGNDRGTELRIAAGEQAKITRLRLSRLDFSSPQAIPLVPLTREAFAPFGEVVEGGVGQAIMVNQGRGEKFKLSRKFENRRASADLCLSVFRIKPSTLPLQVDLLEKHPHSSQAFIPQINQGEQNHGSPYLVLVAKGGDEPDVSSLKAFMAQPSQGIVYDTGVWHYPLVALDEGRDFCCLVYEDDGDPENDTVLHTLSKPAVVQRLT